MNEEIQQQHVGECPNCQHVLDELCKYCQHCGQRLHLPPVTVRSLLAQSWATITNLERGLLYTIQELIFRPGNMLHRYFAGATRAFTPPLRFALLIFAITLLISHYLGMDEVIHKMTTEMRIDNIQSEKQIEMQNKVNAFIFKYLSLVMLLTIPPNALVSRWFYRKQPINFAQHCIIICYTIAIASILGTPFSSVMLIFFKDSNLTIMWFSTYIITLFVYTYVYYRFFKQHLLLTLVKVLLINILGYVLFMLGGLVIGMVIGLAYAILKKHLGF